jgi:alkylation response protein AidB-like acyl-CoA dehydrogenase
MHLVPRTLFGEEHEAYRDTIRRFIEREIVPHYLAWEDAGQVPRELWRRAGTLGMLCPDVPERYGGPGGDFLLNAIVHEELARVGAGSFSACLISHSDINASYLMELGTEEQKRSWLPRMVSGSVISAIGMSEPGAGSDLKAMRTVARKESQGYVLNGQKTFITNGHNADVVIVAARTTPRDTKPGISLFLVDTQTAGFRRGRLLEKVGQKAGDTAELFFDDVLIPHNCLLGHEDQGFGAMMSLMPRERLAIAMTAVSEAESALQWTLEHVKKRVAFGRPLAELQTVRFKVAELASALAVARTFVDSCLQKQVAGRLELRSAVIAKWWVTDTSYAVIDDCLQLFGGYGYMREFPISRAWVDSRVHRIYGGTNEIMKDIIGKGLLADGDADTRSASQGETRSKS